LNATRPHCTFDGGRLICVLRKPADVLTPLRALDQSLNRADVCPPAGCPNYLVSGDRRGVLKSGTHGGIHFIRAGEFLAVLGMKPAR
jgi:hypothetical protein